MKWTITMSNKELERKSEIEKALDKRITQKEGAEKLGISERQMRRLIQLFKKGGTAGIVSKKRGVPSNRKIPEEVENKAMAFISRPILRDFGPTLMTEKLEQMERIRLSKETVRRLMIEVGIHQAKSRKPVKIHCMRERRPCRGELVQIDGSKHAWLEERAPKATLLVFIDDATSEILSLEFVEEESFFAYGEVCKRYFREVGLPMSFYSDRFSVFRTNRSKNLVYEPVTQFQRALSVLDVKLICASSPEAKGRVERANATLQDRLIKEMRLRNICTYQDANAYLPEFIQQHNRRFAVQASMDHDVHRKLDPQEDLDFLFSIHDVRQISMTLTIHCDNKVYQILTTHQPYFYAKQEVLITKNHSGEISAWFHGNKLELKELRSNPKQGVIVSSKSPDARPVAPAYNHPWRTYGKKINGKPMVTSLQ
jgi:transposase